MKNKNKNIVFDVSTIIYGGNESDNYIQYKVFSADVYLVSRSLKQCGYKARKCFK